MTFTPEMLNVAKNAKSAEELIALAKEHNIDATEEAISAYFEEINKTGELADDELDSVAGGGCGSDSKICTKCGSDNCAYNSEIQYYVCGSCGNRFR